jgi:energy-coupling factor transporter ATP-binding protein EcfA2
MIKKVIFKDLEKLPNNCRYIKNTNIFKEGEEIEFSEGINLIIGKNGSGKSSLINIIGSYLMCNSLMRSKVSHLELSNLIDYNILESTFKLLDGVDVIYDYRISAFKIIDKAEGYPITGENIPESVIINSEINHRSRGEMNLSRMNIISSLMYTKEYHMFDISEYEKNNEFRLFKEYMKRNNYVPESPRFTLLLDEPDNNLDMYEINRLYDDIIEGSNTSQFLVVAHNPALIYKLMSNKDVNVIEMTKDYGEYINNFFNLIINGQSDN